MDILSYLTIFISALSWLISIFSVFQIILRNKEDYFAAKNQKEKIFENIKIINHNSKIDIIHNIPENASKDDVKIKLYWYCCSIINALEELYPNKDFSLSIKKLINDSVYTILNTGKDLFLDNSVLNINRSTEYRAIINEGYEYFFVTDLSAFDKKMKKYDNGDTQWKYKYNTAIVFPVKQKEIIVGFICINSPHKLHKRKNNENLIKLLETTKDYIANAIIHFPMDVE